MKDGKNERQVRDNDQGSLDQWWTSATIAEASKPDYAGRARDLAAEEGRLQSRIWQAAWMKNR